MSKSIQKLFLLLSPTTKRFIPFILLSLLFIGFLEMLSVLLLMPLISSSQINGVGSGMSNTSLSSGLGVIGMIYKFFTISEIKEMAILVIFFMFLKHILIITLNYAQFRIIFNNDIWLRNSLLDKYLTFDYLKFNKVRSSELIRNTADQVGQISYGSLLSLLTIINEAIVIVVLLVLVLYSIPLLSAISIILVFLLGLLPFYVFKKQMILLGKTRFNSVAKTISEIQNIHNLYIEIKLYRLKPFFLKRVKSQSVIFSNAQIQNNTITNIPKGIIEIAAVVVILVLIVTTKSGKDFLPTIALIVTSIFRITPSFTRISSSLTQYKFSIEQINVLNSIILENHNNSPLINNLITENQFSIFQKDICLKNIEFIDFDAITYTKIFKTLSSIRIDKNSIEILKTIIVKHI
jgi:ABC-type multidrug transport system fused ATPase/permease subunit